MRKPRPIVFPEGVKPTEEELRINALATEYSAKFFDALPTPNDPGVPLDIHYQALLMALGVSIGSLISRSPFSASEQIGHWNLIGQYALTQVILPDHKELDELSAVVEDPQGWEPEEQGSAH